MYNVKSGVAGQDASMYVLPCLHMPRNNERPCLDAACAPCLDAACARSSNQDNPAAVQSCSWVNVLLTLVVLCRFPYGPRSMYELGSTTKAYTTTLTQILVEQGYLSWTQNISCFFPEVRFNDHEIASITLSELSTHTSGLPARPWNLPSERPAYEPYANFTLAELQVGAASCWLCLFMMVDVVTRWRMCSGVLANSDIWTRGGYTKRRVHIL